MSRITTHVLDVAAGVPAAGIPVRLERQVDGGWEVLVDEVTDIDGRAKLQDADAKSQAGEYRLTFDVMAYFADSGTESFYSSIPIIFRVGDADHYHVPLLLSPFGYSTYRGS